MKTGWETRGRLLLLARLVEVLEVPFPSEIFSLCKFHPQERIFAHTGPGSLELGILQLESNSLLLGDAVDSLKRSKEGLRYGYGGAVPS